MTQHVGGRRFGAQSQPCCDFCIGPDVRWEFPTEQFILEPSGRHPLFIDDGRWGACDACKDDIEAERWKNISARLYANMKHDVRPNERIDHLSQEWQERLIAAFIAHRNGPPFPSD